MNESVPLPTVNAGGCGCGHHDEGLPELDVRTIPHAIRHGSVFGAFDSIAPGGAFVLVAPHNPLPLLSQLAERAPITVEYLSEGPDAWRLQINKMTAAV